MRKFLILLAAVLALALVAILRPGGRDFAARTPEFAALYPLATNDSARGIVTFALGDWDALGSATLRTSASPWKIANAAMALRQAGGDVALAGRTDIAALYRQFGFLTPQSIGNWPEGLPQPALHSPVGQNVGFGGRHWPPIGATVANIGCAACHASVMYEADGSPDTTRLWLGMPNGSINLEAYTQTLFTALREHGGETGALFATLRALYPDTGLRERLTLRLFVLPALMDEITTRDAAYGRLLPFRASLRGHERAR